MLHFDQIKHAMRSLGFNHDHECATSLTLLQFLFLEPNASDPLNKEAAEDLKQHRENFKRNVRNAMAGGHVAGVTFDRVLLGR